MLTKIFGKRVRTNLNLESTLQLKIARFRIDIKIVQAQ